MARPDTIREQLRETQRDFSAAILAGDEIEAAGAADLYAMLADWARRCGIKPDPLRMPALPTPEPEPTPTDPLAYVMTPSGPQLLLPGQLPPSEPTQAGHLQHRMF